MNDDQSNLPTPIVATLAGIPSMLVPACVKALDRLLGATMDVPIAWLNQKKLQIDARTQALTVVESSVAASVASWAEGDQDTIQRAANVLINKEYRKQVNREQVATAMLEDLARPEPSAYAEASPNSDGPDADWLNVFERHSEDASSERMQQLWGRVLAGEIRKPGRFSLRTLRFLSEFSKEDGELFASLSGVAFSNIMPTSLVRDLIKNDVRKILTLQNLGLIQGFGSDGLMNKRTFNSEGMIGIKDDDICLLLIGKPGEKLTLDSYALTQMGMEIISIVPDRDKSLAARNVASAVRCSEITGASLCSVLPGGYMRVEEVLWGEGQTAD